MSLYGAAVKRPVMTSLCFVAVIIMGMFSLTKLPIDLLPDIETNTLMVITMYPGASAEDIEQNVTKPLENVLNSVEHLKHITSSSRENTAVITLEFEFGYDIDVLTNDVRDKLDMVESRLPDGCENPIIFKFSTDMIPICMLSAEATESMSGLYKILDDAVVNPLARIDGVGSVSVSGAPKREIHVYCDPNKLEAYGISVEQISNIIGAENRNIPGGSFDIGSNTYSLRVQGEFDKAKEMEALPVGSYNGKIVYLRDVARIDDSLEERTQRSYVNGKEGATIIIQKQSGANSVQISEKVMKMLPTLQKNLPSDVKLGVIVDTSDNIKNTIASLEETVMYALLFVMIVVFAFLGRWRATMIIVITIPVSLIASFIYLAITGETLNIISLSALSISIGMVVDDAIVVLENVTTHIERGSDPKQAAVHGTNEVAISVIASTLTLIAVFFPLTMVTGMTGVLFRQLGWMVTIMMIISTTCALSLTPMLCSQWLRLRTTTSKTFKTFYGPIERALDSFDNGYARLLAWVVSHRTITITACLATFFGSLFLMRFVGTEFFPMQDNARLGVNLEMPIGTRAEITEETMMRLDSLWRKKYPEIQVMNFTSGPASSDNMFASLSENGSHIASVNIRLSNPGDRERGIKEIADEMREDLKTKFPEFRKTTVNIGGGRGAGMGGQSIVDFEIYGYDFEETDSVAQDLKRVLSSIKGTADITISRAEYQPEYQVDFDRDKLAMYGLNMQTVAYVLRNRVNGATASYFREDGEEYDVKVMFEPNRRISIPDIENISISTPSGEQIKVKDLGQVVEHFTPPTIERKDRERVITVSTVVDGAPMSQVVEQAQAKIDKMNLPSGISISLSGSYEDQQESFRDLMMLGLLIIILVYIVMAAQFESLTYPGIIMTSLLFAFSGVFLILWMTGHTLNVMSMIGAIMLIGIVVKNGIVLIDYITLNRERGMGIRAAVVDGGKSRLRPVVMTTLTTILGMVPMAVGSGQGAEMWAPMGTAVIGGLTFSTILTLLFVPVLYCVFAGRGVKNQRRKHGKALAKANSEAIEN